MPFGEDAGEGVDEFGVVVEDRLDKGDGVRVVPWVVMKDAAAVFDARRIEVEDIAVQGQRDPIAPGADFAEQGVDHRGNRAVGRAGALAVAHPEVLSRLELAEMDVGDNDDVMH